MAGATTRAGATREEPEDSRERILRAALEAFSEQGFDGATTRSIAARAGVNLGLIQYYFDGKQKLWRAAVDRAFESLRAVLEQGADDGSVLRDPDRARDMIRRYVHFVAQNPEFVRIMHDEGKRPGPRMRWLVDRHVRPLHEAVMVVLRAAQSRALLPAHIDPVHFLYIFIGAGDTIFHQAEECRRLTGIDPMDPAVVEAHAEAVVHLLLGAGDSA